ncbi:GNAT family N-acetyltransferase [Rhodobacter ferrooxidans]|uniref:GCN5-related N-acetyltransferase n=1 Tax=Rhodobacter ferrooxidans TaxID=371731 RepID=C8S198_9RHOB|nr:GNAT family N-acetyltransferase [Rhodobacter sp. SW2]EEW25296.1 GCN5-related N-acetyltransferase [Rhodobacter sp. SW2]
MTAITLRDLSGMAEFRQAEALQREVWGEGDLPDPADLMMVIQAEGGLVGGAFAEGRLLGYVFGFPTRDPGVQHSHRLAVLAGARGHGLGVRLKHYQRDWCLARGITRVRWTFDPLRAVNATLNIHRLGAQSDTYLEDYYGEMAGINSGLGSDRLLVDWDLDAPVVAALARGEARQLNRAEPVALALPEDVGQLATVDPDRARDLRQDLRGRLQTAFANGRRIVDFDRQNRIYLLSE